MGEQLDLVFCQFADLNVKLHDGCLVLVDLGTVLQRSELVLHLLELGLMLQLLHLQLALFQHLVAHVRDRRLVVNALREALVVHGILVLVDNLELLRLYKSIVSIKT